MKLKPRFLALVFAFDVYLPFPCMVRAANYSHYAKHFRFFPALYELCYSHLIGYLCAFDDLGWQGGIIRRQTPYIKTLLRRISSMSRIVSSSRLGRVVASLFHVQTQWGISLHIYLMFL